MILRIAQGEKPEQEISEMYGIKNVRTGKIVASTPDMKTAKNWLKAQMKLDKMNHALLPDFFQIETYEIVEVA